MRVLNLVADCDITRSQIQFVIEFTVEKTCSFSYEALYRVCSETFLPHIHNSDKNVL